MDVLRKALEVCQRRVSVGPAACQDLPLLHPQGRTSFVHLVESPAPRPRSTAQGKQDDSFADAVRQTRDMQLRMGTARRSMEGERHHLLGTAPCFVVACHGEMCTHTHMAMWGERWNPQCKGRAHC